MEPDVQLSPRVLLAVGDPELRRVASSTLRSRGYSVCATTEEEAALTLARSFSPDVVMVDLRLTSPEGGLLFDTMRSLTDAYIVGIAGPGGPESDHDRIRALRAGADDVVAHDLNPEELAARCHALLRRPRKLHARWDPMQASLIDFGPLTVDVGRKEIRVHGADVPVTRIEFALFEQLCRRPAEVCSRAELLEEVWGPNWVGDTHVVDVHLSNLRRKLQQLAPELRFIHTVRGVGFRLSNDLLRASEAQQRARHEQDHLLVSA
jgi:two-component system OmpR family response regulator